MATLLLVGLGNPGKKYQQTRHNIGWMLVDQLAGRLGVELQEDRELNGFYGEGEVHGHRLALLRPLTFMNLSGVATRKAQVRLGIANDEVLCAVDEIQLDTGRLKLSTGGSDGGHNGLASLITDLGGDTFRRLRLGVGPYRKEEAEGGLKGFVLSRFRADEQTLLDAILELGCDAVEYWLEQGGDAAGFVKATSFANAKSRQPLNILAKEAAKTEAVDATTSEKEATEPMPATPAQAQEELETTPERPRGFFGRLKALFQRGH